MTLILIGGFISGFGHSYIILVSISKIVQKRKQKNIYIHNMDWSDNMFIQYFIAFHMTKLRW